jgi:hypothetical protein
LPFRRLRPGGKRRSAAEENRLARAVEEAARLSGDESTGLRHGAGGPIVEDLRPEELWARLTGQDGAAYAWEEVIEGPGGTWITSSRQGTTTILPAYEVNANQAVPLPSVVRLVASRGDGCFLFSHCCT